MNMNKLDFLNENLDCGKLSQHGMNVLFSIYKKSYMTIDELAEIAKLSKIKIVTMLSNMMKMSPALVESSNGKYLTTLDCDEIINSCAVEWFNFKNPDYKPSSGGQVKRPIGKHMDDFRDYVLNNFDPGYFSNVKISRQNYKMILADKKDGFKILEIRNNGKFRVVVSKNNKKIINTLSEIEGMSFIPASDKSYVCKFDYDCSYDLIDEIIEIVKSI